MLCSDKDETNHIINEYIKLTQKEYKTRHDWMGKVIHRGLCKKLKFDHPTKWYMHKPESLRMNKMQKLLGDYEIWIDRLIPAGIPDQMIIIKKEKRKKKEKKRTYRLEDFVVKANYRRNMKETATAFLLLMFSPQKWLFTKGDITPQISNIAFLYGSSVAVFIIIIIMSCH